MELANGTKWPNQVRIGAFLATISRDMSHETPNRKERKLPIAKTDGDLTWFIPMSFVVLKVGVVEVQSNASVSWLSVGVFIVYNQLTFIESESKSNVNLFEKKNSVLCFQIFIQILPPTHNKRQFCVTARGVPHVAYWIPPGPIRGGGTTVLSLGYPWSCPFLVLFRGVSPVLSRGYLLSCTINRTEVPLSPNRIGYLQTGRGCHLRQDQDRTGQDQRYPPNKHTNKMKTSPSHPTTHAGGMKRCPWKVHIELINLINLIQESQ